MTIGFETNFNRVVIAVILWKEWASTVGNFEWRRMVFEKHHYSLRSF
jgi:hypothetical protein